MPNWVDKCRKADLQADVTCTVVACFNLVSTLVLFIAIWPGDHSIHHMHSKLWITCPLSLSQEGACKGEGSGEGTGACMVGRVLERDLRF